MLIFGGFPLYSERNDGRIDLQLPFLEPYSSPVYTHSPFIDPLLSGLLGSNYKLKRMQAVIALNLSDGISDQHWHRDTDLLWPNDSSFDDHDVHQSSNGMHTPAYAINLFIPLVDINDTNGPTEFTLSSHQWSTDWQVDEAATTPVDRKFDLPRGSMLLFDYRTIHRGTANTG
jgi:ectoine hydroxylase-related dioxygenase (phytanoyl-CoA dioxygenase family)